MYAPILFNGYDNTLRLVRILGEDAGYEFYQKGDPQAFEQIEAYNKRRVEDRLTFDMLKSYCEALGIRPFDEDFYNPRKAMLIDEYGKLPPHRNFSLEEAWQDFGPK